jgi:hypothetical protein
MVPLRLCEARSASPDSRVESSQFHQVVVERPGSLAIAGGETLSSGVEAGKRLAGRLGTSVYRRNVAT